MTNKVDRTYNVNIKRLALLTLPTRLRRPLAGALIYAGVSPLGRLLYELRSFRDATRYRLSHNGQVCKLRGMLNDQFDPELRRIRIEDASEAAAGEVQAVYVRSEAKWIHIPVRGGRGVLVHRNGFAGVSGYDFWVIAPASLSDTQTEIRMRATINNYKLASKRFAINYI